MQEFERTTPVTVALRAHRGTVDITAADDPTVQVDVVPLDGSEAAADAARNTRVSLDGDTLTVHTPETSGWRWHRAARLGITIRVPSGSSLAAKTGSADLRAAGRYATVQVSTASGDVWLEEATGSAHIEAASGDLGAGRIGGTLRIGSSSGDVEVGDVTDDVTAKSASGDISIRSVGGSATADTASGDLRIGLVRRGQCRLSSASGDIEVGVAAGTGVWLDVSTASGDTVNELRMSGRPGLGTSGLGTSGPGTPGLGTPGLGTPGPGTPGLGTPGLGTPTAGTSDEAQSRAALELRVRTASGDIHIRRVAGDVPAAA